MTTGTPARADPPHDLVEAVTRVATAEGGCWFPELDGGPLRVRPAGGQARARCYLYRFELGSGPLTRSVVVKVRHSRPTLRRLDRFEDRPVLAPVRTLSDEDTARREYDGLRLISDALRDADPGRFGVLRPLAWLPEHAAIVTDLVREPTLRSAVLRGSRLRWGRGQPLEATAWRNAGAWLRLFHTHPTALPLETRAGTAAEVAALFERFTGFLRDRLGTRTVLGRLADAGAALSRDALPGDLVTGTGHGDFVATNLFLGPGGRVTGFDPLPLWRLPVHQDLATLVVGLRVHPLQASTQGLALPVQRLERYEEALLEGYFDGEPVPWPGVLSFQLLALMDRWTALLSARGRHGGGLRPHVQETRVRLASRHYGAEARRLLDSLERCADGREPLPR